MRVAEFVLAIKLNNFCLFHNDRFMVFRKISLLA